MQSTHTDRPSIKVEPSNPVVEQLTLVPHASEIIVAAITDTIRLVLSTFSDMLNGVMPGNDQTSPIFTTMPSSSTEQSNI